MTRQILSDETLAGRAIDLTNCDREPIHIPGSIQPHGCLLACDNACRNLLFHSANAPELLGFGDDLVGQPLSQVIGGQNTHDLLNKLTASGSGSRPVPVFGMQINGQSFDVSIHRFANRAIIELEPAAQQYAAQLGMARTVIERLRALHDVEMLIEQAAVLFQAQLGYDRVMVYELGPDGAGKVVSEARQDRQESFRGQYFPASDIPQQARALYLKNPIRMIGDTSFTPVPILPLPDPQEPALDLSHAHLRSVSPIHCEYLRNMGVAASMSISIIVDNALWGLIACHHDSPKVLSMAERAAAEMAGDFFSMQLATLIRNQARDAETVARRALDDLLVDASRNDDVSTALQNRLPQLADLIPSQGVALSFDGAWSALGHAPAQDDVAPLLQLAETVAVGEVFSTDSLSELLPDAPDLTAQAAGVMIVPLSKRPRDYLFYFRREAVQTLEWAGDPNKTYETGPFGDRLTPRKSFAIWKETVRNRSHPWSDADRSFAEAIRMSVVEVLLFNNELLADERSRAAVRQRLLNQELNHRVKNILAVIRSLVSTRPGPDQGLPEYVDALRGRIEALAFAHDQIVRDEDGGDLHALLGAELGPYETAKRITLDGPAVTLDARAFSVMALVLHEMATNAAKYGALSQPTGHLKVTWQLDQAGDCAIRWSETGVTDVRAPSRTGFGSSLIERAVPFDLDGTSQIDFTADGVVADFTVPGRFLRTGAAPAPAAIPAKVVAPHDDAPGDTLAGRRVLLVEDQVLIAMALEAELQDFGLTVAGIAPSVEKALALLAQDTPDLAVLDLSLNGETSIPIAEALMERGIRFIFATGYGADVELPEGFETVPVVSKPYQIEDILRALRNA